MQATIGVWSPTLQEVRSHSVLASLSVSTLYFWTMMWQTHECMYSLTQVFTIVQYLKLAITTVGDKEAGQKGLTSCCTLHGLRRAALGRTHSQESNWFQLLAGVESA